MSGYGVILADPPWQYTVNVGNGVAENHYATMSGAELKALPIPHMALADSILLLWTTWPFIEQALSLVRAWDFEYKTVIPWVKIRELNVGLFDRQATLVPTWGTGFWARGCTEPLIVAKRGNTKSPNDPPLGLLTNDRGALLSVGPRLEHSRKLNNIYEYAELFPGPYLELFARRRRPGWDVFGNEVEGSIAMPAQGAVL